MIVGGRNDEICKNLNTPFLDDIHLFLLDQKAWVSVKYTPMSQKLYRLGNHSMATMSDFEKFEKTVVFGGITHSKIGLPISSPSKDNKFKKQKSMKLDKKSQQNETENSMMADDT